MLRRVWIRERGRKLNSEDLWTIECGEKEKGSKKDGKYQISILDRERRQRSQGERDEHQSFPPRKISYQFRFFSDGSILKAHFQLVCTCMVKVSQRQQYWHLESIHCLVCWGWGLEHCKFFSSIPDLYPLDASSTSSVITIKNISRYIQISPEKQNHL